MEECVNWDEWLKNKEEQLTSKGYRKYHQNWKSEDFAYWKTFYNNDTKLYMVGVFFYDWRKYPNANLNNNRISVLYECSLILTEDRVDLDISKNIDIEEFEKIAHSFFLSIYPLIKNK